MRFSLGVIFLLLAIPESGRGAIIYDNGLGPVGGLASDVQHLLGQVVADDFILSNPNTTVGGVNFYGEYRQMPVPTEDFTINFYADNGGDPSAPIDPPIASYHLGSNVNRTFIDATASTTLFFYNATLDAPLNLAADTVYWISIQNNTSLENFWIWKQVPFLAGGVGFKNVNTEGWVRSLPGEVGLSFQLTDGVSAVPEPAGIAILAVALFAFCGLGLAGRRKRSVASPV